VIWLIQLLLWHHRGESLLQQIVEKLIAPTDALKKHAFGGKVEET
jgi:hypothetical protein